MRERECVCVCERESVCVCVCVGDSIKIDTEGEVREGENIMLVIM